MRISETLYWASQTVASSSVWSSDDAFTLIGLVKASLSEIGK